MGRFCSDIPPGIPTEPEPSTDSHELCERPSVFAQLLRPRSKPSSIQSESSLPQGPSLGAMLIGGINRGHSDFQINDRPG